MKTLLIIFIIININILTIKKSYSANVNVTPNAAGYSTLGAAFTAINNHLHGSGNIFITLSGNTIETGQGILNGNNYTSLIIRPSVPNVVITGNFAGDIIWLLSGASNLTLDGRIGGVGSTIDLKLENTYSGGECIAIDNFSKNNTIQYVECKATDGGDLIRIYHSPVMSTNIVQNCIINGGWCGIYLQHANFNNIIRNNKIKNMKYNAIHSMSSYSTANILIENNEIFMENPSSISNFVGFLLYPAGTVSFKKNTIRDIKLNSPGNMICGIRLEYEYVDNAVVNIENNFFTLGSSLNPNPNTSWVYGIHTTTGRPVVINNIHNSIYIGGSSSGSSNSYGIINDGGITSAIYNEYNNIVVIQRPGNQTGNSVNQSSVIYHADNNCYFTSNLQNGNIGRLNSSIYHALPEYQCAAFPNEQNSIFKNVTFANVNAGDLHLNGSSIGDYDLIGKTGLSITNDIDPADIRSLITPYMGADESTPFTFDGTIRVKAYINGIPVPDLYTKHLTIEIWQCNAAGETVGTSPLPSTIPAFNDYFSVTGSTIVNCPAALSLPPGDRFYIQIKYPGTHETWSKFGGETFSTIPGQYLDYDFTSSTSQGFCENLMSCGCKAYIFNGDTNNDGDVDTDDMNTMIPNTTCTLYGWPKGLFITGVYTDFNGDGITNCDDVDIVCKTMKFWAVIYSDPTGSIYTNRPPSALLNYICDVTPGVGCTCP